MVDELARLLNKASPLSHTRVHSQLSKLTPGVLRKMGEVHQTHQRRGLKKRPKRKIAPLRRRKK